MIDLKYIEEIGKSRLTGSDLDFFLRVWRGDPEVYVNRLKAIGFNEAGKVLDAGCGFGQWSLALSGMNEEVYSLDYNPVRIEVLKLLVEHQSGLRIIPTSGSIDQMSYPDNFFDSVFCYSCIYFTDYRKSVAEIHRVLKPGGKVYICSNGLGWYLHNLINGHNSSDNFDPREMAIQTIDNTFNYLSGLGSRPGGQVIIGSDRMSAYMKETGFEKIVTGSEGSLKTNLDIPVKRFYPDGYFGKEGVYEILAWKR
jgi:SAM-dependent methyltransferase